MCLSSSLFSGRQVSEIMSKSLLCLKIRFSFQSVMNIHITSSSGGKLLD